MKMTTKDLSKEEKATLREMLDYFCSKINFSESNLDSTAVRCMDTLFKKLDNKEKLII